MITVKVTQPIWPQIIIVSDRRMDRQTHKILWQSHVVISNKTTNLDLKCYEQFCFVQIYTVSQKRRHQVCMIISPNMYQFSKFIHCHALQEICKCVTTLPCKAIMPENEYVRVYHVCCGNVDERYTQNSVNVWQKATAILHKIYSSQFLLLRHHINFH